MPVIAEEFEALAAAFYRETGMMAPGKSMPLEMCGSQPDDDRRAERWRHWLSGVTAEQVRERFHDDLADAHAEYMNEASGLTDDECREEMEDR